MMRERLTVLLSLVTIPGAMFADEYLYLFTRFDTDGFAPRSAPGEGNFDGAGASFPAGSLPAGRLLTVRSARFGDVVFLRPRTEGTEMNFVACRGQEISVRTTNVFNVLLVVGAAHNGAADGEIEFRFGDDRRATAPLGLSDWWHLPPSYGEETAFAMPYAFEGRDAPPGGKIRLWLQQVPIPIEARLTSLKLPDVPTLKIAGMTLASREGVRKLPRSIPAAEPSPAEVGIFFEPGFPSYLGLGGQAPLALRERLRAHGIEAELLAARDLASLRLLTPKRYPVVVNSYGNTFPADAVEALRAYRKAGGAMIHTGVPFTHPVRRTTYGTWTDTGHVTDLLTHAGLGSGGFQTVPETTLRAGDLASSWGLGELPWDQLGLRRDLWLDALLVQGIAANVLAEGDAVLSLVEAKGAGDAPLAAVVKHGACEYAGAIDIRVGPADFLAPATRLGVALRAEMIVRGAAWILREKGIIEDAQWEEVASACRIEELTRRVPPLVVSDENPLMTIPAAASPPRRVAFVNVENLTDAERTLLASAQGLLNRKKGDALFLAATTSDVRAVKFLVSREAVTSVDELSITEALALVGHRQAVVVDPDVYGSLNLATMISARENVLVAYPGDIARYGLEVAADLRGLFSSAPEVLRFAITNLWPQANRSTLLLIPPLPSAYELRDHAIATGMFVWWIPGIEERSAPGSAPHEEYELLAGLLAELPLGAPVCSAGASLHGGGLPDRSIVEAASRYAKPRVQLDGLSNLSLLSAIRPEGDGSDPGAGRQAQAERPVDERKLYITTIQRTEARSLLRTLTLPPGSSRSVLGTASEPLIDELVPIVRERLAAFTQETSTTGAAGFGHFSLESFGSAFGPEAPRAARTFLGRVPEFLAEHGYEFWLLPAGTDPAAVPAAADPSTKGATMPLFVPYVAAADPPRNLFTAHESVGGRMAVYDTGPHLESVLGAWKAGTLPDGVLPAFVWTLPGNLSRLQRAELVGEDVEVVTPRELSRLAAAWHRDRALAHDELITRGAVWRYHDGGEDLGAGWKAAGYDDSGWSSGKAELGYGDASEGRPETTVVSFGGDERNKQLTTYFRGEFSVSEGGEIRALLLDVLADDGVVVYLNGKEVLRENLPEGEVSYSTRAVRALGGSDEYAWRQTYLRPSAVRAGPNIIAAEVHQSGPTSSDLSFDLRLSAFRWGTPTRGGS